MLISIVTSNGLKMALLKFWIWFPEKFFASRNSTRGLMDRICVAFEFSSKSVLFATNLANKKWFGLNDWPRAEGQIIFNVKMTILRLRNEFFWNSIFHHPTVCIFSQTPRNIIYYFYMTHTV